MGPCSMGDRGEIISSLMGEENGIRGKPWVGGCNPDAGSVVESCEADNPPADVAITNGIL